MSHHIDTCYFNSPVGNLKLKASEDSLTAIHFHDSDAHHPDASSVSNPILSDTVQQLNNYFDGRLKSFDLSVQPNGTTFQKKVWHELGGIPYGATITYKELAERLGDHKKVRAVGRANGQNPLAIIVPCHRVIGSNNKLTGYAGGIERKRWLLQHEGAILL